MKDGLSNQWPTEEDLDWMVSAVQRQTADGEVWLHQHFSGGENTKSFRSLINIIVSVWEGGRLGKESVLKEIAEVKDGQ